jgi:hypothetical protein
LAAASDSALPCAASGSNVCCPVTHEPCTARVTPQAGQSLQSLAASAVPEVVVAPRSTRELVNGVVYTDQHHSVSLCGPVIVTFSSDAPNPRYLLAWDQATAKLAARVTGPIFVLTIIDGVTPTPDEPSRKAIRHTIVRHQDRIGAFAYVVEGRGFGAAAIRSAVSLMSLAARYPFSQKVFSNVTEASHWLARAQGAGSDVPKVLASIEAMRCQPRFSAAG